MRYRAKNRSKSTTASSSREIAFLAFLLGSLLFAYLLIVPEQTGIAGLAVSRVLFEFFGRSALVIPAAILMLGVAHARSAAKTSWRLDIVWAVVIVACSAGGLSLAGYASGGGWFGDRIAPLIGRLFGRYLGVAVFAVMAAVSCARLVRISLRTIGAAFIGALVADYRRWQMARRSAPPGKATVRSPGIEKKKDLPVGTESTDTPTIVTPESAAPPKPQPRSTAPASRPSRSPDEQPPAAPVIPADVAAPYELPSLDLLTGDTGPDGAPERDELLGRAELLTRTLSDFGIVAVVKDIIPGPVVTRYDLEPAPGVKIQSIAGLSDNIALALKAVAVRVVAVPEKSAVGIEVPNNTSGMVGLRGILASPEFRDPPSLLTLALGKTTDGASYAARLDAMPHLLVAGATGSGKSVGIHAIILSILYKARPDQVKLLLIDPKRVEMPIYRGLPHLFDPRLPAEQADIITQPAAAAESLKRMVQVMESRYHRYAHAAVRNIEGFNERMKQTGGRPDHYIVIVIDELADLMLAASSDVEDSIQRLAQMARAVGIHLILTTQRPSVNVITGVIKANFPARIAFQTTSKVDSRVILDMIGAEALLGRGDMLFMPPGESRPVRLQGAFVSVAEAERVVSAIRAQNFPRVYEVLSSEPAPVNAGSMPPPFDRENQDLSQALYLIMERKRVSQDLLKAHFGSSARATNILSILEMRDFIHKPEGTNRWIIHFDRIEQAIAPGGPLAERPTAP